MTVLVELAGVQRARPGSTGTLDAGWRGRRQERQERALPQGDVVVSCPAPLGAGGLGRHLEEIVDALQRRQQPHRVIGEPVPAPVRAAPAANLRIRALGGARRFVRLSPAARHLVASARFDAAATRALPRGEHLLAFNGTALEQFQAAAGLGFSSVGLVAANPHFGRVVARHREAHRQYPIERPWSTRLLARNLAEYERAQRIYVSSQYVRDSFLQAGFDDAMLEPFPLTPHRRFVPARDPGVDRFEIVYVGALTVHKGVPLLIDAFRRLDHSDLRLRLVGGVKTRGMRRFIERECAADARISAGPGDPLSALGAARLYVHAAYEDGFAYAPAEALACGVAVVVSEDTGMKELVDPGRTGVVVPTGDARTLAGAIEAAYRGELVRAPTRRPQA